MATEIIMPQLSDTMDQGTILKWFKKEGDSVSRGDALAEVATDKADLEIESFHEGVLLKIEAGEGETVKVGSLIAVVGNAGESVSPSRASTSPVTDSTSGDGQSTEKSEQNNGASSNGSPHREEQKKSSEDKIITLSQPASSPVSNSEYEAKSGSNIKEESGERVKISPLAKNIAKSHGIDYSQVSGTGEGGRIVRKDVEKIISTGPTTKSSATSSSPAPSMTNTAPKPQVVSSQAGVRIEPLSRMRETIAARMVESVNTAPHFYATSRIEVDSLLKSREVLKSKEEYEGITITHLILKAVALSLRAFPRINAKYDNGHLVEPQNINIGIITALPDGLLIPVVKEADALSLGEIVSESKALIQRARAGKPKADDLQGGTFSISNIGRNEVEHFTAIINPGQGAILAVSSIQDEALVKGDAVVPGKTLRVTLSVDHRIIDGVMAGEFLTHLKKLLEEPILIFA